jgi:hypothetical protein
LDILVINEDEVEIDPKLAEETILAEIETERLTQLKVKFY